MKIYEHFDHISVGSSRNEKIFRLNLRENSNTSFISNEFLRKSCRVRDNEESIVETDRPQRKHKTAHAL